MTACTAMISTATGAVLARKALKSRPACEPIKMLGGSPINVAVPPMFEANTSANRNGYGGSSSSSAITSVTGTIKQDGADIVQHGGKERRGDLQHEQDAGRVRLHPLRRPDGEILEKPGATRDRDQDHHAGKQADRVPIDAPDRLALIERANDDDDHRPDQRHHRAIERAGNNESVGDGEHRQRDPHRIEAEHDVGRECTVHAAHFAMKFRQLYCGT